MLTTTQPISEFIQQHRASLSTPYYLIDEFALQKNMEIISRVRQQSGAKAVLALKCFSTWSAFPLMRESLDGTTSSSLFEARLGHEKFGKETHAYSVAWSDEEVAQVRPYATKIIFNSISQLRRYYAQVQGLSIGLRINPGVSYSDFDLADPARPHSRLGALALPEIMNASSLIEGAMFHCNCENDNFGKFSAILDHIATTFEPLLHQLKWVSLGGGIYFTKEGYPLDAFCRKLAEFAQRFDVQVYLEPGESAITRSGYFVTRVLDIVHNAADIAIVDAAVETHMLDLIIYRTPAKIEGPSKGNCTYTIAGRTCLAGDIFGTYTFAEPLRIGDLVTFADAAGYTMVKKNWFNGVPMPSIVIRRLNGQAEVVRRFDYDEYLGSLS